MKKVILIAILLISSNYGFAQKEDKISLKEFIIKFESLYDVKVFYKEEWLNKYFVKNSFDTKRTMKSLLINSFLDQKDLNYYLYKNSYLIITESEVIDKRIVINDNKTNVYKNTEINSDKVNIIYEIGTPGKEGKYFTLKGSVKEAISGQKLAGVSVITNDGKIGTSTNSNGEYTIYLPKGYNVLNYRYLGMKPTLRKLRLNSNGLLNVSLEQKVNLLDEISITGEEAKKERQLLGYSKLKLLDINEIPTFMGEVDIIKYSLLLPGIQSVGEMDMSFSVRGGKGDQNLILVDGMHTYSHSHFFGLFPGINPYSIDDAQLYKTSIPIEYGNRLSSVYDIKLKKGDQKKYRLEGGISPVSSNLQFNGPIIKDKLSFIGSYRGTYSNWILDMIDVKELERSTVSFYDYNIKLNYDINLKNKLSAFFTQSYDDFSFNKEEEYRTYNTIASLNLDRFFENDIRLETILGFTRYLAQRSEIPTEKYASLKNHSISDVKLNSKLNFYKNDKHQIISGIELVYHEVNPWNIEPHSESSMIDKVQLNKDKAIEASLFLGDKIKLRKFTLDLGLRLSTYSFLGKNNKFVYKDNMLTNNIIDTLFYRKNELIDFNWGPEIRISGNYELRKNQNFNFCYNRNRQYISILTNSQAITPISSWQLSNKYIPPQIADQYSLGYNINLHSNMFTTSIELYYKKIKNLKDFKNGSDFELNQHPETEIVNGKGKAYGIELMLKKNMGRLSGWISYTYSRSYIKSKSDIPEKNINNGKYYPTSYDKPHNISAIINYEPTKRFIISNVINYSSGVPVTLPVSKMQINGNYYMIFSDRNEYRLPYYFRWDVSVSVRGSLKRNKKVNGLLVFSVYNLLGRNNTYSIYYENEDNKINGYQLSIFGNPIPTITYRFNF